MGIQIDAHAVDAIAFERVLERPLWRILSDLADPNGSQLGEDLLFEAFDSDAMEHYRVLPDRRMLLVRRGGPRTVLTHEALAEVPFLRRTTRQYLSEPDGSGLMLLFLLRDFPVVDGYRYAYEVTRGHRRWWMGSVLHAAAGDRLPSPELEELAGYFARILSGYDCGYPLAPHEPQHPSLEFPIVPDPDARVSVFGEAECRRFIHLLDRLMESRPQFHCPPSLSRHEEDPDWTDYVTERVNEFRGISTLPLPNLRLVTCIG